MAAPFQDDFESYSTGDLNGQGSWSGHAEFDVQGTTVFEGLKAVSINPTDTREITKSGTAQTDGSITFYFRVSAVVDGVAGRFLLRESTTDCVHVAWYGVSGTGTVFYHDSGGSPVSMGNYLANTWYSLKIEWRSSDKKVRYSFNEGAFTEWVAAQTAFTTSLDGVKLQVAASGALTFYFDYISETWIRLDCTASAGLGTINYDGFDPSIDIRIDFSAPLGEIDYSGFNPTIILDNLWKNPDKNDEDFIGASKHSATMAGQTKNNAVFTGQSKNTESFTGSAKTSASWTGRTKS